MEFDPYDPEVRADPYPAYRRLRRRAPVSRNAAGFWFVTAYDDAQAVLRDRRFGRNFDRFLESQIGDGPLRTLFDAMMLYKDPPDHTRLRSLVAQAFTARTIAEMRSEVQRLVDELLDRRVDAGTLDVVEDFGHPLPVRVICRMLGIPESDTPLFRGWSRALGAALDYVLTPEIVATANAAAEAGMAYLRALAAERRRAPREDLLTRLLAAEAEGDRLTETELIGTCMILFGAGHETTTGLIGNGMLALLRHPDQLERLRRDPALVPSAVDELLRYDAPVQMAGRVANERVTMRDVAIEPGDVVVVLIGAANHDEARFPLPERLDVGRPDNAPLSFGGGVHYCLGAPLAKLEAEIAFASLIRRCADLRLTGGDPMWRDTVVLRSLASLAVAFTPAR